MATAEGASFGDGVNIQPAYYCSGQQELGWDLMDQYPDIESVRIEIEPFSFQETGHTREQGKRWLDEADQHGKQVVATYHHYPDNGSADVSALQNAADFWVEHYDYLSQDADFVINLMNEWGNHDVTASQYASAYNDAISTVREGTDYTGPIICDVPGWGQNIDVAAEAAGMLEDDNLIQSAHIYPSAWHASAGEWLKPSHLDALDETEYPCMIGEFGANRDGEADWSAIVDYAKELGWPVFGWAWNGDGEDQPMNMADPGWIDQPCASSYTTSDYFSVVYDKLGGDSADSTAPTAPSGLTASGETTSSASVSWDAASDSGGSGLDHYVVTVDGTQNQTVDAGTTAATVTGLDAGTTYEFGVRAVDGAGNASGTATATAATADSTEQPTLSVDLSADEASAEDAVEATIRLSSAPDGVSGYTLDVTVGDTGVATIEEAAYPGLFNQGTDVAADGSSASLQAIDGNRTIEPGAEDVELATVTLQARAVGETEVAVEMADLDADDGGDVPVTTTAGTLTVAESAPSPIDGVVPQDIDGDGKYMDLNANGKIDGDDVVIYFNNYDQSEITDHVSAYDYNDSGDIDFDDIVTLFQEY